MYFEDKVNSVPFLGFQAGTVKCDFIDGESGFENNTAFVTTTYQFSVRRDNFSPDSPGDPWDWAVVDQGPMWKDADGNLQAFTDGNGNVAPSGLLNSFGGKLADGDAPWIIAFRQYERADFTPLNLP